jgi:hypothetical protein
MTVSSSSQAARFFDPAEDYRHSNFNSLRTLPAFFAATCKSTRGCPRRALDFM